VGAIVGHRNSVNSLAFSPDEKLLATSSSDGTVRVWSFPDGRPDLVLDKQVAARFSPTGRYLATLSTRGHISLWDMPGGKAVVRVEPIDRRLFALAFTPDERHLLAGGTGSVHRIAIPEGKVEPSVEAHQQAVTALRVSPDGRTLASTGYPGEAKFWSVDEMSPRATVPLGGTGVMSLAFAPDSSQINVSIDFYIVTIGLKDYTVTNRLRVGVKGVYGLACSPDGRYLAAASADGKVRVWEQE
jgi:WD40 repeat protein